MKKIALFLSSIFLLLSIPVFSQLAGSVDLTFNPGLGATNGSGASTREVFESIVLPNGQIVVGGYFGNFGGSANHNRIAKLNSDGTIDVTFVSSITSSNSSTNFKVKCLELQADGKLLVGGNFTNYEGYVRNHIVRINLDGTIDMSFDPGSGAAGTASYVDDIKIQADGKILVAGSFTSFNGYNYSGLVRLNTDGSLDNTFIPQTGNYQFSFQTIAIQSDGKIIAGGSFAYIGTSLVKIVRFNTDGTLDLTFNPNSTGSATNINKVLIQPDGKILIAGGFSSFNDNPNIKYITRVDTEGVIDNSFNVGSSPSGPIYDLNLDSNGKIVIVGFFSTWNGLNQRRILRIHNNGSFDSSFNSGGGADNTINCVTSQPDGKYLIGGYFDDYDGETRRRFARLNGDGTNEIVDEIIINKEILIYPNPVTSILKIQIPDKSIISDYVIYDFFGKKVKVGKIEQAVVSIDLSELVDGLYTISFENDLKVCRFVKE